MPPAKRPRTTAEGDMSEYKDAKGVVYELQAGYTTGEVVILSDDHAAWKVKRSVLTDSSPVFRDMFVDATSNVDEVNLPDSTRADLDLFIRTLYEKNPPNVPIMADLRKAIDLLCQYDCTEPAKRILYHNVKVVEAEHLFDAFTLASRLNDVMSACRILAHGWRWYQNPRDEIYPNAPSLCPDSTKRRWCAQEAALLQPAWIWALTVASAAQMDKAAGEDLYDGSESAWRELVGGFMCNLVQ